MGKASRRTGTRREENGDYGRPGRRLLDRAGLCRIRPGPRLWDYLSAKLPRSYVTRLRDVMKAREGGDGGIDLYPLLWQNRETARATYGWIAPISEAWLAWIEQHGSLGRRILDLGCGIGVHTCFYAMRHPDSEVVGIDRSAEGVARAEELAAELALDNVRFICADATLLQPTDVGGPSDTVTASTFLADVKPDLFVAADEDPWSIVRSMELALEKTSPMLVERLASFVADGGVYLGLERAPDPVAFARWIGALHHADLEVDSSSVTRLRINGHVERIPALRATRQTTQPSLQELTTLVRGVFGSRFAEEDRLAADPPVQWLWGRELLVRDQHGSGMTRVEVLRLHSGAIVYYHSTSRGYRELTTVATPEVGIQRGEDFLRNGVLGPVRR